MTVLFNCMFIIQKILLKYLSLDGTKFALELNTHSFVLLM